MSYPVKFHGANKILGPPPGEDEHSCTSLPVFNNGVHSVSCWKLEPNEIEEIVASGQVWAVVRAGASQPPIFVGSRRTARDLIADQGVWSNKSEKV